MRLLLGRQPPWLIALGGVLILAIGYARGSVVAMGIGVLVLIIAGIRQLL